MKLSKTYLIEHKNEISNTFYCKCVYDCVFASSSSTAHCYKSMIYKFSQDENSNKNLIFEKQVIDIDKEYIFEECKVPMDDTKINFYFEPIGNLLDLINYIEGE